MIRIPELLAPAGNMERLETALRFGADAVYIGAQNMSLRNYADNFTYDELRIASRYAHERGKKIYVTCNAFAKDKDIDALPGLLDAIQDAGADALIVNDPGVIRCAKKLAPGLPLHLSTQANTLNAEAAAFWHDQGVERIILARELSLDEIRVIRERAPAGLELEMFVHGAMCISYSGRCLLSNYLAGRDSNKGECAQPCRWTYELRETGSGGDFYPIEQHEKGTFLLNSRDLNLIEHLPEVLDTGVCSLKIEGRMKSISYVATVVNAYRMALDDLSAAACEGRPWELKDAIRDELSHASHRPYTTGFAFGDPGGAGQAAMSAAYIADSEISAVALSYNPDNQTALIEQRNRFFDGDILSVLSPLNIGSQIKVNGIWSEGGERLISAPHPRQKLIIGCAQALKPGDILRKNK